MIRELLKGAALKKLIGFGARHKMLGVGGFLAALAYRNRHRLKQLVQHRQAPEPEERMV